MMGIVGKEFLGEVRPPPHQTATKERERERERERKYRREQRREAGEEEFRKEHSRINAFFFIDKLAQDYLINTVYYTLTESHQSSRAGTQIKDFGFLYFDFVLSFDPPVPSPVGRAKPVVAFIHSIPFRSLGVAVAFRLSFVLNI